MSKNNKLDDKEVIKQLITFAQKQQVKIKELKYKLHSYQAMEVFDAWKIMGASQEEIKKVLSMLKDVEVL